MVVWWPLTRSLVGRHVRNSSDLIRPDLPLGLPPSQAHKRRVASIVNAPQPHHFQDSAGKLNRATSIHQGHDIAVPEIPVTATPVWAISVVLVAW